VSSVLTPHHGAQLTVTQACEAFHSNGPAHRGRWPWSLTPKLTATSWRIILAPAMQDALSAGIRRRMRHNQERTLAKILGVSFRTRQAQNAHLSCTAARGGRLTSVQTLSVRYGRRLPSAAYNIGRKWDRTSGIPFTPLLHASSLGGP
jgi:hypothetical protein